jgi:hypothetical protein
LGKDDRPNSAPHISEFRPAAHHTFPKTIKNPNKKQKINTRFKRYLNIFAEDRIRLGKPGTSFRFLSAFTIFAQHGKSVAAKSGKSVLRATFHVLVHNDRLKSDGLP